MSVTHVNPPALHESPVYSQGVIVETPRTLYVGGQNGTDADGAIAGDIARQSAQAVRTCWPCWRRPARGPSTSRA